MEIKPKKIITDVDLIERLRKILFFQIVIPLPLYLLFLFLQFAIVKVISSSVLSVVLVYFPLGVVIGAAVLFTPYLFYVLIKEKRYGWITIFFFMVALPYIFILLIFYGFILLTAWLLVPIILFYLYCFLLKYSVEDWLKEYYAHEQYEEQKRESEQRKKDEMLWSP